MITGHRSTPNQVAKRLIGRDYLSYSALNTFRACPLRFKFHYLDGLPEASVSSSLVFGSAIHRAAGARDISSATKQVHRGKKVPRPVAQQTKRLVKCPASPTCRRRRGPRTPCRH